MELDDAKGIDLPPGLKGVVVIVCDDTLYAIAFVSRGGKVPVKRLLRIPIGINEVRVVFVDDVHDS
jgi:hypothetical protein